MQAAQGFESAARKDAASQAEEMFRATEARVTCLPPIVIARAETLELQGKYLEAIVQYRRLLDARAVLEGQEFWGKELAAAEAGVSAALAQVGSVVIDLKRGDCTSSPRVFLANASVGFDKPISVNPGQYDVRVEAAECRVSPASPARAIVAPGQSAFVTVTLKRIDGDFEWWPWAVAGGAAIVAGSVIGIVVASQSEQQAPQTYNCSAANKAALGCAVLSLGR